MWLLRLNRRVGEAANLFLDLPHEMQCVELLGLEICGAGGADRLWGC